MRPLVTIAALLLAFTANAQTPPAAEATAPAAEPVKKETKKADDTLTLKSGPNTLRLYLLIDATIGTMDNASAKFERMTTFRNAWLSGNRWGLQGRHVVNEDLAVIAKLESEYLLTTGEEDTAGVLFNRDAWIGFDSKLVGQITFGRQNTLARDFAQNYGDAYGSAGVRMDEGGWTNTNNFKQLIYYAGGWNGNTRLDRSVILKRKIGDFMIGLGYGMGNQAGQFAKNGTASIGLAWNGGPYNVSGYYTQANVNNQVNKSYSIGGNVRPIKLVRLNAGYFHYTAEQGTWGDRTDDAWTASVKLSPADAYDFELGYVEMKAKNAAQTGAGASLNTVNAFKDTTGTNITGVGNGSRSTIYASVFYHLTSQAEVYLAGDYLSLSDNYKVGATFGKNNQTELVVGLRFKM